MVCCLCCFVLYACWLYVFVLFVCDRCCDVANIVVEWLIVFVCIRKKAMCAYDLFACLCICCRCVCSVHALVRFVFELLCVVLRRGFVLCCCV